MRARVAILALSLAILCDPASSQQFNQFVGFGDSTIDSGWYRNLAFPTGNAAVDAGLPRRLPMAAASRPQARDP